MSLTMTAIVGIVLLLALFFLNMPVSFAMFIVGFLGIYYVVGTNAALSLLTTDLWGQLSAYSLSVIPLFVLMGEVIYRSGIAKGLFNSAYRWLGHFRGGMAWTTILASAGFGSIAGSNAATCATIGTMALPELKHYKYHKGLSAGTIAAGGTLGIIIPPSTVILIISLQTGLAVGDLFMAIMIPGILLTILFMVMVSILCWRRPEYGPASTEHFTLREKFASLKEVIPIILLFLFSVGGLFLGWFTPTESGAFGAVGAIVLALGKRALSWKDFLLAVVNSLRSSAMVIFLIVSATVFGRFLAITRTPYAIAEWTSELSVAPVFVFSIILLLFIVGGALMDAIGFLVLAIPIFYPTMIGLGYDPIWLATILCIVTSLGAITPPVGVNVFVTHGLDKSISPTEIFKGTGIFIVAYFILFALLIMFPWLVTGLV